MSVDWLLIFHVNAFFTQETDMKISVVPELCAGEGICESDAPELFEIVDGLAVVKVETVPAELEESAREACANCPTEAIVIEE